MTIVTGTALECNKNFRVNFNGGNLSSDGGLLLLKEFYHKIGAPSLLEKRFHTTDPDTRASIKTMKICCKCCIRSLPPIFRMITQMR